MSDLARFLEYAAAAPEAEAFRQRRELLQSGGTAFAEAAVLVGFVPETAQGSSVVLTVRSSHLRSHGSQIAFPGGRCDEGDADAAATALRETEEELGVEAGMWRIHGHFPNCYVPSGYKVTPVLATAEQPPSYRPNPQEVAAVFTLPQDWALDPQRYVLEDYRYHGRALLMPALQYGEHRIWGATATVLYQLALLHEAWRG
ncbi:NUDIX hydrolase [Neisseria shayeganii]|uniref:CoA pyrophosphatase n=1 Tax=Neisseria shayeganii TaxID=607712 RepID=A0A7D7NAU0_9NEIS|nr:CoA pyrophosphatase [Neisseria shayeganii]QMT39836.1 CoA pyrophosphatase [Neisseria shayeganii]